MSEFNHFVDAFKCVFSTFFMWLFGITMICNGEWIGAVFIVLAIPMTAITYIIVTKDYDREEKESKR